MNIDEQIEILQAIKAGKTVQWRPRVEPADTQPWHDNENGVSCNFAGFDYRIKPEPQTRTIWINCYHNHDAVMYGYDTVTKAQRAGTGPVARKKVTFTFTPGEFDE